MEKLNPREEVLLELCIVITGNTMPLGKARFLACPRLIFLKGQAIFRSNA